ncbi:MAG: hypothetical protein GOU97_02420, partial [Nanoarchaeota archaeon]|nr:hypothetical protein [Nanoarchaeota archaeon]
MMRKETILLITALLVISIFYRSIHFNNEKLFGNDPYFHLAVIKDAITKGEIDFTPEFSFFEEERPLFEPDGLYLATIIPHQILFKHLGLSIVQSFKIIPILFGITALTFFFLITRKVFGKKTALFSTLILSISVAHVYRSMAGHYRGDNFFLTITLASIYLFFLALDQKNTKKSILLYTISGILGGLNYFFWNGYPLYFIIMTIGIVAGFITHFLKG